MERGWIKIWRRLAESPHWLEEPFTRGQAWVDLILLANHKVGHIRKRGIKVEVQRGEIAWSERILAQRWKWSRGKLRRFFRQLSNDGQIMEKTVPQMEPQNKNVISRLYIINYELYQGDGTTSGPTNGTTDGPQTDRRRYQNKNDKNKKKKTPLPPIEGFDDFWKAYPKKQGKKDALKAWAKLKPSNGSREAILKAVATQKDSPGWQKHGGQFIPLPATWLRGERWKDETVKVKDWHEDYPEL